MANTSTNSAGKKSARRTAIAVNQIQKLAGFMETTMKTHFPVLYGCPNSLYIMMATMGLESSFRVWPNGSNANHVTIGTGSGIGRSYYTDPLILPKYQSPATYSTTVPTLNEGLSAKALMATMGMYQIRGTRESKAVLSLGGYSALAEANGLMVEPGQSASAVFTNDDVGAQRSIVMGCIIMEGKVRNRLKKSVKSEAIRMAVGDYLGKAGAKDVLGTSPEMRMAAVNSSNNAISKTLAAAGLTSGSSGVYVALPNTQGGGTSTINTANVGSSSAGNPAVARNGCTPKNA